MRLGIAAKLSLPAVLLVVLATTLTAWLLYSNASATLTDHELTDLQDETALRGRELLGSLDQLRADMLYLAGASATRAVLVAHIQSGETGNVITPAERGAAEGFAAVARRFLAERNAYTSVRYVRNDEPRSEIVVVRRDGDRAATDIASGKSWGDDREVAEALRSGPQVVTFSEVRVGESDLSLTAAVPIHSADPTRGVYGVVAVEIDFGRLIDRLKRTPRHLVYLADDRGRLLLHPEFLQAGGRPDPVRVDDDPDLAALVREAEGNAQPPTAGLAACPLGRHDFHLPRFAFWLASSKPLSPAVDRRALDRALTSLVRSDPAVKAGRVAPNAQTVYVSSRDLGRLNDALDRIRDEFGTGVEFNDPLRCENFAFQHVTLSLTTPEGSRPRSFGLTLAASTEEIDSDISRAFRAVMNLTVALGVLVAVLALLFSMLLTRPLKQMTHAAELIADGESADLSTTRDRTDEIGTLARAMERMIDQVGQRTRALRISEGQVRSILEAAGDAILTLDGGGNIRSFNPAAEHLFGYLQGEVIGTSYRRLVPRETVPLPDVADAGGPVSISSSLERRVGIRRELTGCRKDGSTFPAEVSVNAVPSGDGRTYTVVLRDITEQKRVEEVLESRVQERTAELSEANHTLEQARDAALEASRAKDAFLRNMSHELRTPLNVIDGYTRDLLEDADDEDTKHVLGNIARASAHLIEVIEDILDMGKIEAGKLELMPEEFALCPLVEQAVEMLGPLMRSKGNQYSLTCPADLGSVRLDRKRVKQVLLNLLGNANKFTDKGKIRLDVERSGDWVIFRVADTGRGMKEDEIKRLFQPFYQADSSTTRKHQGTGLGLAISRRLCQLMGGEIGVTSEYGKGSTFTVRLPIRVREPEPKPAAPVPRAEPPSRRNLILVVDDDPASRDLLERFLRKEGYDIRTAATGEEALAAVREARPLAIVLDALLPGIDGWAVLAALKSDPKTASIPIIMASILDDARRGFALGATDYITKPIDWSRLSHVLAAHRTHQGTSPVLVVEDDTPTREMVVRMLAREGWRTQEAANGLEGLARLAEERPALVLLDLMMPEMDGFAFVQSLRADDRWKSLPVVVVTAADLSEEDRARLNGRVEQIVRKGAYAPEELLEEVRRQVERAAGGVTA